MKKIETKERIFINTFCNSDLLTYGLPKMQELHEINNFLSNEICYKYIGNIIKDIDIELYINYKDILIRNLNINDNFEIENSNCEGQILNGEVKDIQLNIKPIKNTLDLLIFSHEIGHALNLFKEKKNNNLLHYPSIYDETVSILFGKLCQDRYIYDFGYDEYIFQFELYNIKNAIECLKELKKTLPILTKKQNELKNIQKNLNKNNNFYELNKEVNFLQQRINVLIRYPIGISLLNVYDNLEKEKKLEYLMYVAKYLLRNEICDFKIILENFDIPFDAKFYISNFKEYINNFENNKKMILRGK